jgi:hypothetical protein
VTGSDLQGQQPPLLISEALGRREVPLRDLPAGVVALTVPRTGADGPRVPRDRRRRIAPAEVDLATPDPVLPFQPPASLSSRDLVWILRTGRSRQWPTVTARFGDTTWDVAVALLRSGGILVRCEVTRDRGFVPLRLRLAEAWASGAADHIRQLTNTPEPAAARSALLDELRAIPELDAELALLTGMPDDDRLRVPPRSRAGTAVWSLYDRAVRAACAWYRDYADKDPVDATELAAVAFRDSHIPWSPALRTAFGNLVGRSFDAAVLPTDTEVTLRGPLRWTVGQVIADAAACQPWIGLPANGLRTLGILESQAKGVLLIENKSNFERVCAIPDVVDRWLCVWGRGYVRNGLVALVRAMSPPHVAAWGDLDAHGVAIVADLARRLERTVHPVGMDPELFRHGVKRTRTEEERWEARRLAADLSVDAPESLRPLAALIAESGDSCEQQTIRAKVTPHLGMLLQAIESRQPPTPPP